MRARQQTICRAALLSVFSFVTYSALRALIYLDFRGRSADYDNPPFHANDISIEEIPIQELGNDFLNSLDILPLEQGRRSSLVKVHNASFENLSGGKKTDLKVPISTPLACDSQTLFQVPRTCTSKLCKKITCHNLLYSPFGYPVFDQARKWMENQKQLFASDSDLRPQFKNCSHFKQSHGYHLTAGTQEEAEFPIAFNIIMHKDFNQVERLLRAIYRPQNVYCIHVDGKSPQSLIEATRELAGCFSNVFVASKLEKVVYAGFSRLQADINCMEDLVSSSRPWRYLLNLAGQAFPLKTNAELVRILKIYNGSNDIEGIFGKRIIRTRFEKVWREKDSKMETVDGKRNPPPPDDIDIVRGSAYGVFSREFVEFILTDNKAKRLLEWSRTTYSPDEHFWATLHHTYVNPHVKAPGSYAGIPNEKPWLAVFVAWGGVDKCRGMWRRGTCVFGVEDLPTLITRRELFANKFYRDHQPLTLECLNAWIEMKTSCPSAHPLDYDYYKTLPFVHKE